MKTIKLWCNQTESPNHENHVPDPFVQNQGSQQVH